MWSRLARASCEGLLALLLDSARLAWSACSCNNFVNARCVTTAYISLSANRPSSVGGLTVSADSIRQGKPCHSASVMNTSEYAHPICRTRPRRFCKLRFHRFKRGLRVMDLAGSLKSATLSDSIKHCRPHNVLNAFGESLSADHRSTALTGRFARRQVCAETSSAHRQTAPTAEHGDERYCTSHRRVQRTATLLHCT